MKMSFSFRTILIGTLLLPVACARPTTRASTAIPQGSAAACFSLDGLSAHEQATARHLLLEAADGEALYTLVGAIKPTSTSTSLTVRVAPSADTAALARLDLLRRVASRLHCGTIGVTVQVFTARQTRADTAYRHADVIIYDRAALRRTIATHASYFRSLAITPDAEPAWTIAAVENADKADRWRGYGYLFGYPDEAVDFFVDAGIIGDSTQTLVPRDFRRIETYRKFPESRGAPPTLSSFVYAVPRGAVPSASDQALTDTSGKVYAEYARRRTLYLAKDSTKIVELLSDWLTRSPSTSASTSPRPR